MGAETTVLLPEEDQAVLDDGPEASDASGNRVAEFWSFVAENADVIVESPRLPGVEMPFGALMAMCGGAVTEENVDRFYAEAISLLLLAKAKAQEKKNGDLELEVEDEVEDLSDEQAPAEIESKEPAGKLAPAASKKRLPAVEANQPAELLSAEAAKPEARPKPKGAVEIQKTPDPAPAIEQTAFSPPVSDIVRDVNSPAPSPRAESARPLESSAPAIKKSPEPITPVKSSSPALKPKIPADTRKGDFKPKDKPAPLETDKIEAPKISTLDDRYEPDILIEDLPAATTEIKPRPKAKIDNHLESVEPTALSPLDTDAFGQGISEFPEDKAVEIEVDYASDSQESPDLLQEGLDLDVYDEAKNIDGPDPAEPLFSGSAEELASPENLDPADQSFDKSLVELGVPIEEVESALEQIVVALENPPMEEDNASVRRLLEEALQAPVKLPVDNSETLTGQEATQENLEELFIQLFKEVQLEYTPELLESFVRLSFNSRLNRPAGKAKTKEEVMTRLQDKGTHEFIKKLLKVVNNIKRAAASAYLIGKSAMRLCSFEFAAI
ncbi:MAG TPA: hypothetical protein VFP35_02780 [Candidatus Saccharimonadales bacterium]|nr:hypothetical protein [Candidatus Saccharimonadales bacterium]